MGWRRGQRLILSVLAAATSASAQPLAGGTSDPLAEARSEFLVAFQRAGAGVVAQADSDRLQSYPLYSYLQAERIGAALGNAADQWTAADSAAERFISNHGGEPVTARLRLIWLASLARRRLWEQFLDQYRNDTGDERQRCQYLAARIELEHISGLAPPILELWLKPRQLSSECEPVFQWLRAEGALTDTHVEQRVRLLLEAGETSFARSVARRLPADRAIGLLRWADLIDRPAAEIDAYLTMPVDAIVPEALLDAWARLSRDDPPSALARYPVLIDSLQLDRSAASPFALALALGLAWDRRPEALSVFADVAARDIDDSALQWRARAALWAGDWEVVAVSIAGMSDELRTTARWRYWAARAAGVRGDRGLEDELYESILTVDNVYSGLAAAQLRRRVRPALEPLPRSPPSVVRLAGEPVLVRARELRHVGLPVAAMREWRYGFEPLDPGLQRQAIHLAADWQWYDLAVATATRFEIFNDYPLLYPTPYAEVVREVERTTDLDADLIYGIMRQESLFRADAVSAAGARGLMQLQPGTAAMALRQLGEATAGRPDLDDPAVNIRLGAVALESLLLRFQGKLPVALAAYNAGANAVERWLPREPIAGDIWIENIPFNETREYVGRVLWHSLVYRWLESERTQSTRDWLAPIAQ